MSCIKKKNVAYSAQSLIYWIKLVHKYKEHFDTVRISQLDFSALKNAIKLFFQNLNTTAFSYWRTDPSAGSNFGSLILPIGAVTIDLNLTGLELQRFGQILSLA